MHITICFRIPFPLDTPFFYRVEGQVLTGFRIPFITIACFMFLWTGIRLIRRSHAHFYISMVLLLSLSITGEPR